MSASATIIDSSDDDFVEPVKKKHHVIEQQQLQNTALTTEQNQKCNAQHVRPSRKNNFECKLNCGHKGRSDNIKIHERTCSYAGGERSIPRTHQTAKLTKVCQCGDKFASHKYLCDHVQTVHESACSITNDHFKTVDLFDEFFGDLQKKHVIDFVEERKANYRKSG